MNARSLPPYGIPPELWRAVIYAPDDLTPRLVLADWLDEHDHADRAEFYRLQCRLAILDDAGDRWPLEQREQVLLARHRRQWLDAEIPLRRWGRFDEMPMGGCFSRFRLLNAIEGRHELAELFAGWPIFDLTIDAPPGESILASNLAMMTGLRSIRRLNLMRLDRCMGLDALMNSPHLERLTYLMTFPLNRVDRNLTALLEAITRLGVRELGLMLDFNSMPALRQMLHTLDSQSITHLGIGGESLSEEMLLTLAGSNLMAGLQSLELPDRAIRSLVAAQMLDRQPAWGLRRLDLSRNNLDNAGAIAIAEAEGLSYLEVLNLSRNPIGATGVRALFESPHLAGLRQLTLGGSRLYPTGLLPTEASFAAGLRTLDFSRAGLDAEAISRLKRIEFPRLVTLTLDRNPLGDDGLSHLLDWLPALPELRSLSIRECMLPEELLAEVQTSPKFAHLDELRT